MSEACVECGKEGIFSVSMKRRKPAGQRTCQDCVQKKTGQPKVPAKGSSTADAETLALLNDLLRTEGARAPVGSKAAKKKAARSEEGEREPSRNTSFHDGAPTKQKEGFREEKLASNWDEGTATATSQKTASEAVVFHESRANPLLASETRTRKSKPNAGQLREPEETIDFLAAEFMAEFDEKELAPATATTTTTTTTTTPTTTTAESTTTTTSATTTAPTTAKAAASKAPKAAAPKQQAFPKCFMCGQRHDFGQCRSKNKLRDAELKAIEE